MAYTILNTDGSILLLLADGTVDKFTTSLSLIGKNVSAYGEPLNNNFIKLMANFASSSSSPPNLPLKGQLWYNTTEKRLKVYDGTFKNINGATISTTQPVDLASGDLWFDSVNNQLKIINGNTAYLVGPVYPVSVGDNGWVLPETKIKDTTLIARNTTLIKNYGQTLGIISPLSFDTYGTDAIKYFGTSTFFVVSGLTIKGDIRYSGKINHEYLTVNVDIDKITPSSPNITDETHFVNQTAAIKSLLNRLYPINNTDSKIANPANALSIENGVPAGTEARVLCAYSNPATGYQIRRFYAKKSPATWEYYTITDAATTLTNVIATIPS